MAIKIPNAPEIVGTNPVLRQPDSVNARFEQPNFKVDVSQPVQAIRDVGDAYASFVEQQTDTLMGAACNQFHHDVRQREEELKNTHKGIMANDLYAMLEKDAATILDDITGAPKDDGKVRIANPELQKRFRDWANKQMPAYHARMTSYTAAEMDKANKLILEDNIRRVNESIAEIDNIGTAKAVTEAAKTEYLRAAKLSAPGLPERYQVAEAARMMDEAMFKRMDSMAKTNIVSAAQFYYNVPEIRDAMSSTSKAAFFKSIEDNYVSQGGSRSADLKAAGKPMTESGGYLDPEFMRVALPNKSEAELERIAADVQKKGEDIYSATMEAKRGQAQREYAAAQNMIATTDITNPNQVMQTYQSLNALDPRLANDFAEAAQTQLSDEATITEYNDVFYGDEDVDLGTIISTAAKESDEVVARKLDVLNRYREVQGRMDSWINNPAYIKAFTEAANGTYNGEYREDLNGLPMELRANLASVIEYNKRYNEVTKANPHLDNDLKNLVSNKEAKKPTYMASLQKEVVKSFDAYSRNPAHAGAYPVKDSIDYNRILNEAVRNAKSPSKMNVEKYLDEQAQDLLHAENIDPYLQPEKAIKVLKRNNVLPEAIAYRQDITSSSDAEDIADALIRSYNGKKRRTLETYRDSIIQTIENTGDADFWFMFADGISE